MTWVTNSISATPNHSIAPTLSISRVWHLPQFVRLNRILFHPGDSELLLMLIILRSLTIYTSSPHWQRYIRPMNAEISDILTGNNISDPWMQRYLRPPRYRWLSRKDHHQWTKLLRFLPCYLSLTYSTNIIELRKYEEPSAINSLHQCSPRSFFVHVSLLWYFFFLLWYGKIIPDH